ncbi:hypothetical protein ACFL4G_03185 [Thermodesulfobacteriota bacterium]
MNNLTKAFAVVSLASLTLALLPSCSLNILFPEHGSVTEGEVDVEVEWSDNLKPDTFYATLNNTDITDVFTIGESSASAVLQEVPGIRFLQVLMNESGLNLPVSAYSRFINTSGYPLDTFIGGQTQFVCESSFMEVPIIIPGEDPDLGISETLCDFFQVSGVFPSGDSEFPQEPVLPYMFGVFPYQVTFDHHPDIPDALSMSPVEIDLDLPFDPSDTGAICGIQCVFEGILFPAMPPTPGRIHAAISLEMKDLSLSTVQEQVCQETFYSGPGQTMFVLNYKAEVEDTVRPDVDLTSPSSGVTEASEVVVSGTATDNSLLPPLVTVNGIEVDVDPETGAFWILYELDYGPNTIDVRAEDGSGNVRQLTRTVTQDTVAPELFVDEPVEGALVPDIFVTVSGTTTDDLGPPTVTINGGAVYVDPGSGAFSKEVFVLPGSNEIVVEASDGLHVVTETRNIFVLPDHFILYIMEPADGIFTNQEQVWVRGLSVDPTGVPPAVTVNGDPVTIDPVRFTFESLVDLVPGENVIVVSADNGEEVLTEEIHIFSDPNPPELDVLEPEDDAVVNVQDLVVNGTATDDLMVPVVTVNGEEVDVDPETGAFSTVVTLSIGSNTIRVQASDQVNTVTETRQVIFDEIPPILIAIGPIDGITVDREVAYAIGFVYDERLITPPVLVNGVEIPVDPDFFYFFVEVPLELGENLITISTTDGANDVIVERTVYRVEPEEPL